MTGPDDTTAAEQLGVLLKQTQVVLHQRMDEVLRPLGLRVPQYACLQALADQPGSTGSELARRAFVSRQSMNVLVQGLEGRGLVERSDDRGPRRERTTTLTPTGHALVRRAREAVATVVDAMVAPFAPDDLLRLRTLLEGCRDVLVTAGDAEAT